jgi:hypothetical protein
MEDWKTLILSEIEAHGYCDITGDSDWSTVKGEFNDFLAEHGFESVTMIYQDAARIQKKIVPSLSMDAFDGWAERCLQFGVSHGSCPPVHARNPVRYFPAQRDTQNKLYAKAICLHCGQGCSTRTVPEDGGHCSIGYVAKIGPEYPAEVSRGGKPMYPLTVHGLNLHDVPELSNLLAKHKADASR